MRSDHFSVLASSPVFLFWLLLCCACTHEFALSPPLPLSLSLLLAVWRFCFDTETIMDGETGCSKFKIIAPSMLPTHLISAHSPFFLLTVYIRMRIPPAANQLLQVNTQDMKRHNRAQQERTDHFGVPRVKN